MLATISSATIFGVDGRPVTVEVHAGKGLPGFTVVGLPDTSCREARDRVRAAIMQSGMAWNPTKVTVNLAPSGERKIGTGLDLAIALGFLAATDQLDPTLLAEVSALGELGLDGSVRPIDGVIPLVAALGDGSVIVPTACARQARLVKGTQVRSVDNLTQVVLALRGDQPWPTHLESVSSPPPRALIDLADVRGQPMARKALEVSAAGGHHLLLVGSPGAGKTMLAKRLPTLLPDLDPATSLAVTKVMSAAGVALPGDGLMLRPPFRAPHHSSTLVALVGGGTATLRPGELSLATGGTLFLDELGEFPPSVIDALRQPLEEGVVRVSRARASAVLPANFLLVAATNPCPCGLASETAACSCSESARARYRRRISGPILDRFDLRVEVHRPDPMSLLTTQQGESSQEVAARVLIARQTALSRGVASNSQIAANLLDSLVPLDRDAMHLLEGALRNGRLTARGLAQLRRVSRTIADLEGVDPQSPLGAEPVALAMTLRGGLQGWMRSAA